MKHLALLLILTVAVASSIKVRFENYRLYGVHVENEQQFESLKQIESVPINGYMIWNEITFGSDVLLMVAPNKFVDFIGLMDSLGFKYFLRSDNVQQLIDSEQPAIQSRSFDWTSYKTYEEISAWLDELLVTHANVLREVPFGTSHEGRPIRAVHLSRKSGNPAVIIESNIHANEWITSATATWWLNELLTSTDPAVRELSENLEWYIVPVFNVDGFTFSHRVNRMWRKSRHNHAHLCVGTDLNRNFDFHWMANGGASQNPCSESYGGPKPFSDIESQHLARFVQAHANQTKLYLAFHSYGQFVLLPYGYTREPAPTHSILKSIGDKAKEGFAKRNGTNYTVGQASVEMYYASGLSSDWAYGTQNIPLAYTFEFRDSRAGPYGFLLPADQILPNCYETRDAIIAMVAEARRQNVM